MTSLIERSWPTASGVSVSGKVTVSRSGRTGSASGSGSWLRIASLGVGDLDDLDLGGLDLVPPSMRLGRVGVCHGYYSARSIGTWRAPCGTRTGSSTRRIPSS